MESPIDRYRFFVERAKSRRVEYPYTVAELELNDFNVDTIVEGSITEAGFERLKLDDSGSRILNANTLEYQRYFVPWPNLAVGEKIWKVYKGEKAAKDAETRLSPALDPRGWSDPVLSPSHYDLPGGIQVIDLIRGESFLRGNALKYIFRAPHKGKELEDMKKSREYINWEIERLENE
jgi:hypothetical protein